MMRLHLRRHSLRRSYAWLGVICLGASSCGSEIGITSREVPAAAGSQSADPALAIDPVSGDLVMSWVEGDGRTWALYAARSAKSGDWSAPVRVSSFDDNRLHVVLIVFAFSRFTALEERS